MSTALVIRYETRPDQADTNQRLVEQVFAELAAKDPRGLRYASFRDGARFMHIALVEGERNPLEETAAFQEFQAGLGNRLVGTPERTEVTLVGSYGFLLEKGAER